MNQIYQTEVTGAGPESGAFADQGMFVLFGEEAPDMLKEFCYFVHVNPVEGEIVPGLGFYINDTRYPITAVGDVAAKNLGALGHITIVFNGASKPHLPGAINVENPGDAFPVLVPGDTLRIA
ncbi:PTS system, glucitol/sorbitol-specific IIA component [Corynebacterium glutamicum]|uniref:PTS glucitol/sorbitol transporter subunit IIA n=1 Tax=Corynebacterium glutamicum TaxID=1718 RepID=UPI00097F69FA|nr:PTS glucitol/sorbitol transporter subunit IIA [Corynebacterium glutamicum]SJM71236.1 PTS system, glucitol/sorbitol-specific IIA component [Corynebacterium glutamicum]